MNTPVGTFLATHYFFEVRQAPFQLLNDLSFCKQLLLTLAEKAEVSPLESVSTQFYPQGCSVVLLLSESHASIHTWPEQGVALIDLFSCSRSIEIQSFIQTLQDSFPEIEIELDYQQFPRGKYFSKKISRKN
ncbi:MAG: adenosylmethionine decarboxylase [Planctomycetota bacterium]